MTLRLRVPSRAVSFFILASATGACASSDRSAPAPRAVAPLPSAAPPSAPADDEVPPKGPLPRDVHPLASTLDFVVDPTRHSFSGVATITIELSRPRKLLWLHGRRLHVSNVEIVPAATGRSVSATYRQATESGDALVRFAEPVAAGRATLHFSYDAPFGSGAEGLYQVKRGGESYAFTQFEAIDARTAFPCFDEPAFKIPFTVSVSTPASGNAISNTHEVARERLDNGMVRVRFAPTKPLPSYLVALAAGPFDIVEAAPLPPNAVRTTALPFRGIAARGRGPDFAYALAHTAEIVAALENYVGIAYPYDKLDLLAVPEKEGAMENPGAITFREDLILLDQKRASARQKRAFASVTAHELAHQWFGDLVTSAWWDDIWLNEAFATWLGSKSLDALNPALHANTDLLAGVHGAMATDSLSRARQIRQPIESNHDIANAFDGITYQKGAGVLSMFERWIGPDHFRAGIHEYLESNSYKSTTVTDLMSALSHAAGKDVATPFRTFLDQPGVPYIETALQCGGEPKLQWKQSRYVPAGSSANRDLMWQIPFCARVQDGASSRVVCDLLTGADGSMRLGGAACPTWLFPNADAAGYFRFRPAPSDLRAIASAALPALSVREKMAYADALRAGFNRGDIQSDAVLESVSRFIDEPFPPLSAEAARYVATARDWFAQDDQRIAAVESRGRSLYGPLFKKLGWQSSTKTEDDDTAMRRLDVIAFLALVARDPSVRAEAARRGRAFVGFGGDGKIHKDAVSADLVATCLSVAGEDATPALFDHLLGVLATTEDESVRGPVVGALAAARDPVLAKRARDLSLDPRLRGREVLTPIGTQLAVPATREEAWRWLKENFDPYFQRLSRRRAMSLAYGVARFCDDAQARDAEDFLGTRIDKIDGGPRALASAIEEIHLCAQRKQAQEQSLWAYFAAPPKRGP